MGQKHDKFSVKLVLLAENGGNTGVLEGTVHMHDTQMQFEVHGKQISCPFDSIERVSIDSAPEALSQYFERELLLQWSHEDDRWRAVIELKSGSVREFAGHVCSRTLGDTELRVEQTVTPYSVTPENDMQEQVAKTPLAIDQQTEAITFESADVRSIHPGDVITVQQGTREYDQTQHRAVRVKTLCSGETVDTTLVVPDSQHVLLHDYIVIASTLSETGGPIQVLLVDDEPGLTEVGKLHITDKHDGLAIQCATSTEQALDLLREHDYECIVTDYAMPDGGAPDIIELNKKQEVTSKVIIYSRKDRDKIPDDKIPVGIDLWVKKKAETEQYHRLGNTIKRLVASRRNRQRQKGR